jgi:hypothetical protein
VAKKEALRGNPGSNKADPTDENVAERKALSKEAWVAIGTIAAALITGIVTLIIHLLPPAEKSPAAAVASPSPVVLPSIQTADAIAGKWSGTARDSRGKRFSLRLRSENPARLTNDVVRSAFPTCHVMEKFFWTRPQDLEFEFRVDNFDARSNRSVCQPGGGEHFKLRPDGRLVYSTTYEPKADGLLERRGD